ncbi:MAG: glycosyltransferase, partial [Syntrophobacteraceae bacterium]
MEPKPTVSLCMIVRNEEHSLPGCLESVKGLVDEIVIVDTGSTDQTAKVARSHGARVIPFTWTDDFSAARNESLRHAQGDWIFYLDADERLIRAGVEDCLRAAAAIPGVDARSVLIKNRLSEAEDDFNITSNIRLFRRIPGIRFEGEVHERVELFLARRGACVTPAPFRIDHLGYAGGESVLKDKLRRNLALSLRRCAEAPDDAYALHYLGQTLLLLDRKEESRDALERALHTNDLPRYLHCIILDLLACIDLSEGRFDEAIARAESSLSMTPRQSSARLTIGLARYQQRDFAAALPHLRHAYQFLRLPPESRPTELSQDYSFVQPADILKALAVCHAETGKYATAIPLFRRYLDARGEDGDILRQIGICHLNEGDYWNAFQYLRRAETMGVPRPHLAVPMAYCALQLQDFPIARQILDDAVRPEDAAMRQKIEQILDDLQKHREDARRAKPSISLCMIVKNEESHLAGCLESVRSSVDEIVIVDTGSADRTVEIARSFGADVYPFPWRNDFAAARNEGLAHARGDWVLYLDADERLNDMGDPDCLHTACAAPGIDAYSVPIVNHKGGRERGEFHVGYAIRLFRRYPGIRFTGRVHERTDAFLEKAGASVARSRFLIEHLGYDVERSGIEAKYRRNLELLREQLQEDPGDTHTLYHVGITLLGLERERESREVFEALLSRGGLPPQLQAVCLNMVSFFLLNEREYAGALRAACDSLAAVPRQNTAKVLAGLAHSRLGEFERAFPFLFEAFQYTDLPPEKRLTDLHHEDTVPRGELLKALATCCAETGKCRQAIVF